MQQEFRYMATWMLGVMALPRPPNNSQSNLRAVMPLGQTAHCGEVTTSDLITAEFRLAAPADPGGMPPLFGRFAGS